MDVVKKIKGYRLLKKRSGRFAVVDAKTGKHVNGDAKRDILHKEGLIKLAKTSKKPEAAAPAEAAAAEETNA